MTPPVATSATVNGLSVTGFLTCIALYLLVGSVEGLQVALDHVRAEAAGEHRLQLGADVLEVDEAGYLHQRADHRGVRDRSTDAFGRDLRRVHRVHFHIRVDAK